MYATAEDLEKALTNSVLAQLTDDENGQVVNQQIVEDAIKKADSIIDAYIRSRYRLPLSPVPELLRELSIRISKYQLYRRRLDTEIPDSIKYEYESAIQLLKDIQSGKASLDVAEERMSFAYQKNTRHRMFPPEEL